MKIPKYVVQCQRHGTMSDKTTGTRWLFVKPPQTKAERTVGCPVCAQMKK